MNYTNIIVGACLLLSINVSAQHPVTDGYTNTEDELRISRGIVVKKIRSIPSTGMLQEWTEESTNRERYYHESVI